MKDLTNVSHYLLGLTGLVICFAGYRITRAVITLAGFVAGAGLIGSIANNYSQGDSMITILSAFLGGLLGAGLALGLYNVGIFILGALAGAATGSLFTSELLFIGIIAIAAGIITLFLKKFMLVVATAMAGALTLILSIYLIRHGQDLSVQHIDIDAIRHYFDQEPALLPAGAALALLGIFFQFKDMRKKDKD